MKMMIPFLVIVGMAVAAVLVWLYTRKPKAPTEWPPEVVAKVKANKEARENVRAADPELFKMCSDALFKSDPMGINFESNTDEYEPEVGTILPRLPSCVTAEDALSVVYEEFSRWFGTDTAGPKERYRPVSDKIWQIWKERPQPATAPYSEPAVRSPQG
jgi:hypothetical protein